MQRITLSPFVTEENGTQRGRAVSSRRPKRRTRTRVSSMTVKLGICVLALAAVTGMYAMDLPAAAEGEVDLDEMLGKLQFVSMPGALAVFGQSADKLALPVNTSVVTVMGTEQMARWESEPNAEVLASAAGEVRAVGEDPVLGLYVRLLHEDDLETVYYGLSEVNVEEGQPVRRLDTLGALGDDGTLCLSVLLEGRPQQPQDYFDVVLNT